MNNKDNENKAKLVPNSEVNEEFDENENPNEDLLKDQLFNFSYAVSYTHLTLPTIYSV